MALHITIVTPEKTILESDGSEIIIPTVKGEIAVLPGHVALFTQLAEGEIVIKQGSKEERMVAVGGFVEISKDKVTVLADYAVHGKDISAVKAEEAKKRAEKAMKEKKSAEDFAIAEAEFRRAILELKVANRTHKRPQ
jgi:F-type H+-transporting ATPase subunit epsilon